jgi:hypothetical protein
MQRGALRLADACRILLHDGREAFEPAQGGVGLVQRELEHRDAHFGIHRSRQLAGRGDPRLRRRGDRRAERLPDRVDNDRSRGVTPR